MGVRYSIEVADRICKRIANGEALIAICRDDDMPSRICFQEWVLADKDGLAIKYARARDLQADHLAEEILEIADDARNDWMAKHGDDAVGWELNGDHVRRSDLRINARKWYASKVAPKKFGERVTNDININPADLREVGTADLVKALKDQGIEVKGR